MYESERVLLCRKNLVLGGVPKKKFGRYGGYDRCGRCGGYDAVKNPPHVVRLDEQSKDPKRSPESPHPMSEENQNRRDL